MKRYINKFAAIGLALIALFWFVPLWWWAIFDINKQIGTVSFATGVIGVGFLCLSMVLSELDQLDSSQDSSQAYRNFEIKFQEFLKAKEEFDRTKRDFELKQEQFELTIIRLEKLRSQENS